MNTLEDRSNAELLELWRNGNEHAARVLVQRYMIRMTALVRSRFSRKLSRRLDPEDVVLSAWRSFFVATRERSANVPSDDDIWPLLVTFSLRKLARQAARHSAGRRDMHVEQDVDQLRDWQEIVARDPSPDDAVVLGDEVEAIMSNLEPLERDVLTRQLQGMDAVTIASELNCSDRTIRRTFQRIRDTIAAHEQNATFSPFNSPAHSRNASPRTARECEPFSPKPTAEFDDFLLQKLIGQGGFGKVYRAACHADGTTVAVKYLKKRFWKDARAKNAFLRETQIVSQLSHPRIIRHRGWGVSPTGTVFIVMEWVDGTDVRTWIDTSHPPIAEILDCGIAVADALCAAHGEGVIHGDVTPANVLRRNDGTFVLTDFGFARSLSLENEIPLGGTANFLAPEQLSDAFGRIGVHTDIYGIGGLLFALLLREPPMTGCDVGEILANVLSARHPDSLCNTRLDIPDDLDRFVLQCLRKEPMERPATMQSVSDELRRIRAHL